MMPSHQVVAGVVAAHRPLPDRNKFFSLWILLALLLTLGGARAEEPDDAYLAIYGVIAQADTLNASGQTSRAHAKYIEAQRALAAFQRANPGWSVNIVSYRMKYLVEKVAATSGPATAPGATTAGKTKETEQAAAPDNGAAALTRQAVSVPNSPVKLLEAGREPRTVLRLHPGVGDKQTLNMTMKLAMTMMTAGGQTPAMTMPAMLMPLDIMVKDIAADGEITFEMVFADATVVTNASTVPAMAAAMKSSLADLRGMTGTGRMSANGIIHHLEMKMPAGADPGLSQMMDQMKESFSDFSNPLPEEAVGPGAKWEYKTQIKSQGMAIDQVATCELVSIAGDRLTLRSTIAQNAADQKIQNPAMPGLTTDLDKLTGAGAGGSTLDLAHIMPMSGTLDEDVEVMMGVNVGQQKQTMDMKEKMNATLEAK